MPSEHEVRQSSSSTRDIGDTEAKSENIELLYTKTHWRKQLPPRVQPNTNGGFTVMGDVTVTALKANGGTLDLAYM